MRGRSGAVVADYQQAASAERKAASAEKIASELYRLALEHCAQGGTEEAFLEEARAQADRAFADPGVAGARRDVACSASTPTARGSPGRARSPSAMGAAAPQRA